MIPMVYVDGFVIPLPKSKVPFYRKMASKAAKVWIEHGALEVRECVAEELTVKDPTGKKQSPFPKMTKLKKNETVFFSWITYKNKAQRNRVNAKVMKDPRIADMMDPKDMPFDMSRMAYAGFETVVDQKR